MLGGRGGRPGVPGGVPTSPLLPTDSSKYGSGVFLVPLRPLVETRVHRSGRKLLPHEWVLLGPDGCKNVCMSRRVCAREQACV